MMTNANRDHMSIEYQLRFLEGARDLCVTDELDEVWKVKIVTLLIEKLCLDGADRRSVNLSDEVLKVLAGAAEPQKGESRKNNVCCWRYDYLIQVRSWMFESHVKALKLSQRGQGCDHHFRINVTGIGYLPESDIDEFVERQNKLWKCWKWNTGQAEILQMWGRPTQEGIRNHWCQLFKKFKVKICQLWIRFLHHIVELFQDSN
jgi:hypothetical protein